MFFTAPQSQTLERIQERIPVPSGIIYRTMALAWVRVFSQTSDLDHINLNFTLLSKAHKFWQLRAASGHVGSRRHLRCGHLRLICRDRWIWRTQTPGERLLGSAGQRNGCRGLPQRNKRSCICTQTFKVSKRFQKNYIITLTLWFLCSGWKKKCSERHGDGRGGW